MKYFALQLIVFKVHGLNLTNTHKLNLLTKPLVTEIVLYKLPQAIYFLTQSTVFRIGNFKAQQPIGFKLIKFFINYFCNFFSRSLQIFCLLHDCPNNCYFKKIGFCSTRWSFFCGANPLMYVSLILGKDLCCYCCADLLLLQLLYLNVDLFDLDKKSLYVGIITFYGTEEKAEDFSLRLIDERKVIIQ